MKKIMTKSTSLVESTYLNKIQWIPSEQIQKQPK